MKLVIKKEELEEVLNGKNSEKISVTRFSKLASSDDLSDLSLTKVDVFSIFLMLEYHKILSINSESHLSTDKMTLKNIIIITMIGQLSDLVIEYSTIEEERELKLDNLGL